MRVSSLQVALCQRRRPLQRPATSRSSIRQRTARLHRRGQRANDSLARSSSNSALAQIGCPVQTDRQNGRHGLRHSERKRVFRQLRECTEEVMTRSLTLSSPLLPRAAQHFDLQPLGKLISRQSGKCQTNLLAFADDSLDMMASTIGYGGRLPARGGPFFWRRPWGIGFSSSRLTEPRPAIQDRLRFLVGIGEPVHSSLHRPSCSPTVSRSRAATTASRSKRTLLPSLM
jgi:hypothetical protein